MNNKAEEILNKEMKEDYPLIPMSEITDEARLLAVAWVDGYEYQGMDIPGKQKLASDIMNYARRHATPLTPPVYGEWIEIKEGCEMPKNEGWVNDSVLFLQNGIIRMGCYDYEFGDWTETGGGIYKNVTHWQPLPSPPKQ